MRSIYISFAGPTIKLKVGKIYHTFEMHKHCGPMRLYADGEPNQNMWPENSPFWNMFNKWLAQGERVDEDGRGIIDE